MTWFGMASAVFVGSLLAKVGRAMLLTLVLRSRYRASGCSEMTSFRKMMEGFL